MEAAKLQAAASDRQSETLKALLSAKKRSTFHINVESKLPILEEVDKNVKAYYDSFEEHCALADDGNGMGKGEMLRYQKESLRGSHKEVYTNEISAARATGPSM